jgi:Ca2+/H+ antiporter, TMEM165/GDT1 family
MVEFFAAFAAAFVIVFLAEMGDKSQLVLLAQASRHPPLRVLAEALAAFAILMALAVTAGALAARVVPQWALAVAAGLLFLAFGAAAVREARENGESHAAVKPRRGGTFALVLVSEMGDKTQVAAAVLAASTGSALAVGLGAFAAEAVAAVLAVAAGAWLGRRLAPQRRTWVAAVAFLAMGVATLAWGLWLRFA